MISDDSEANEPRRVYGSGELLRSIAASAKSPEEIDSAPPVTLLQLYTYSYYIHEPSVYIFPPRVWNEKKCACIYIYIHILYTGRLNVQILKINEFSKKKFDHFISTSNIYFSKKKKNSYIVYFS